MIKDFLNEKELNKSINNGSISFKIFDTLESTNKTAKEFAEKGAKEGTVIIAKEQTGGRGRLGRSFYSPGGTGLYFSIILRPDFSAEENLLITPYAAAAVSIAIEKALNIETKIKWVNDIFVKGKKVCGILSEAKLNSSGATEYIVLGVGINLAPPKGGFPKDIETIAGALLDTPNINIANKIIVKTISNFFEMYSYENFRNRAFYAEYDKRLMLKGQNVNYTENGEVKHGTVLGIDHSFNLIIKPENGEPIHLLSGEVTIGSKEATK